MSSKNYRFILSATSSLMAAAIGALPTAAQEGQSAQGGAGLEEIIVNARRVDENIQRVPIAVSAFSAEKLQQQDVKDIFSLTKNIGGLNICCAPGSNSFIFLRGVANGTPTYFNDVPASSNGFGNFFDVTNVQVLKGPQGTLFGQASNAGALVYQPRKPGEVMGGYVNITGGNYGRRSIEGALDVPIVEDRVLFRAAAQSYYREGYVEDVRSGKQHGEQNYYILRPQLTIRPTDDIENTTLFQLIKSKGVPLGSGFLTDFNFSGLPFDAGTSAQSLANSNTGGNLALFNQLRDQALARQIQLGRYKFEGYSVGCSTPLGPVFGPTNPNAPTTNKISSIDYARTGCPYSWSRDIFFSNTTTWNFADNLSLKNIFGYRKTKTAGQPTDTDATALILSDGGSPRNYLPLSSGANNAPLWSDELQLQGSKVFDFLDFTIGTFHTAQLTKTPIVYSLTATGTGTGVTEGASSTKSEVRSRAVYGQGNIDLGAFSDALEGLTFTGGVRYTWDSLKNIRYTHNVATGAVTSVFGGPGSPFGSANYSALSYTVGFQYQWTPDVMLFVTNAKGYSSGAIGNVFTSPIIQPDVLNNIEGGVKGTFDVAGMKVRTNASYYFGWYSNIKISQSGSFQFNPPPGPPTPGVATLNAGKAHISGIDSDITVLPTDWLEVGGMFAYTRAKYTQYTLPGTVTVTGLPTTTVNVDARSAPFAFVPKYKWSLRGTVHLPVDQASIGDMSFTANFTHTGQMANTSAKPLTAKSTINGVPNPNSALIVQHCRTVANGYGPLSADGKCVRVDVNAAYSNLDLNFDWRDILGNEGLSGSIFVTNVTKNEQNDGGGYLDNAAGFTSALPAVPRMFGVRIGYSF